MTPAGARLPIDLALIDANWGDMTDTVYNASHAAPFPVLPVHGRYIGPQHLPLNFRKPKAGELSGFGYRIPPARPDRPVRHVMVDTNLLKSTLARTISAPIGAPGSFSFCSANGPQLLPAQHIRAEFATELSGPYGNKTVWSQRPGEDNHILDTLVYGIAGAVIKGLTPPGAPVFTIKRKKTQKRDRRFKF
jgi:hypothetical protein